MWKGPDSQVVICFTYFAAQKAGDTTHAHKQSTLPLLGTNRAGVSDVQKTVELLIISQVAFKLPRGLCSQ